MCIRDRRVAEVEDRRRQHRRGMAVTHPRHQIVQPADAARRHHRHAHSQFILLRAMSLQALPQFVLNSNITGLIGSQLHQQQAQVINRTAVIDDELHTLITTIDCSPT